MNEQALAIFCFCWSLAKLSLSLYNQFFKKDLRLMRVVSFSILSMLAILGRFASMVGEVFLVIFRKFPSLSLIRDQMHSMGVMSLPVVAITGFSTGMVLAAQSFYQLSDKGLSSATGLMVTKGMFTELGPVLTAFMVTGRVGSAMCAELASMKVTEQVDALRSMAVNPLRYLVAPRYIAGIVMLPLLTVFSNLMGILGAHLVSISFFGLSPISFYDPISEHISRFDFCSGLFKAFVFGVIITTISCYKGMSTTGGAAGVGKSTTNSVVVCYSCILVINFFLTVLMNMLRISWYRWL